MLKSRLIHPPLLAAAAATGHGSRILLADANYAHDVNVRPGAPVVHLNLMPGLVRVDLILELLAEIVPIEAATTMRPDEGGVPPVWSRYEELLGPELPLQSLERSAFYAAALSPQFAFAVATGDERLYANLLLTVGFVPPSQP
jgi:L-fucose mutarotase